MMFFMLLWVYIHTEQAEKLAWPRWESNPVWIYTQSNIKNIIFTWVHNIKTHTKKLLGSLLWILG
jgi:hypothetical protein